MPNPFFRILTPDKFPGALRNQATVQVQDLLKPYPQYGRLTQLFTPGARQRYQALQLRVQRPFASGFNFLAGYNYNRARNDEFYDEVDQFADKLAGAVDVAGAEREDGIARPRPRGYELGALLEAAAERGDLDDDKNHALDEATATGSSRDPIGARGQLPPVHASGEAGSVLRVPVRTMTKRFLGVDDEQCGLE